jgi:hypothetical protein
MDHRPQLGGVAIEAVQGRLGWSKLLEKLSKAEVVGIELRLPGNNAFYPFFDG